MSVSLYTAPYCDKCGNFEPVTERAYADGKPIHTIVTCERAAICKSIYEYIIEELKKEK